MYVPVHAGIYYKPLTNNVAIIINKHIIPAASPNSHQCSTPEPNLFQKYKQIEDHKNATKSCTVKKKYYYTKYFSFVYLSSNVELFKDIPEYYIYNLFKSYYFILIFKFF